MVLDGHTIHSNAFRCDTYEKSFVHPSHKTYMINHSFDTNEYMLIIDRKDVLRDRFDYLIQQSFILMKCDKIFRFLDYKKKRTDRIKKFRHRF